MLILLNKCHFHITTWQQIYVHAFALCCFDIVSVFSMFFMEVCGAWMNVVNVNSHIQD
jgi:hypothetical protein